MNEKPISLFRMRATALAVASCLSLAPGLADAAGLGRITVLSNLGQPLRAEVEVGANREELSGMTVRLAPQEAFQQAGVDYAPGLSDLRLSLDRRANGTPIIRVTSPKPVNEPFLDFLIELNWPAGRLVREYTFLLDPPEVAAKSSGKPLSVVEGKAVEGVGHANEAEATSTVAPAAKDTPVRAEPRAKPKAEPKPRVEDSAERKSEPAIRVVRKGETLRRIATETQYEGVSLEQMLIGLFRANSDAFIGGNINRMKAGAILNLPEREAVAAIPESEARRVYQAQAADWNAYRQKLAAVVAQGAGKDEAGGQTAGGKITAKVEAKAAAAETARDQVKISRTESAGGAAPAGKQSAEETIAREKALKEAQERIAILEKNVSDLQKLSQLKNQNLAELQKQAAAKKPEEPPVPAPVAAKPVEPPKQASAEPPKPAPVEKPAEKPAEPAKSSEDGKPVEAPKAVEAEKPTPAPKPEAEKPAAPPAPKKLVLPPEPVPEPSLMDELLGNPLTLAGAGGVLALLAGYVFYRRRRQDTGSLSTMLPTSTGPDSAVFRATGGQSVDTGNTTPQTADFSQTGPGTIDTDEVDPVAEADVYMAYGRDAQAEEILLEALQKDPQRTAIHAKLLEIYAARKSLKQFETLATELYAQTGGKGVDWEKAVALGRRLDPSNPLYSVAEATVAESDPEPFDSEATLVISPAAAADFGQPVAESVSTEVEAPAAPLPELDTPTQAPAIAVEEALPGEELAPSELVSLDFDLGAPLEAPAASEPVPVAEEIPAVAAEAQAEANVLDFDLGLPSGGDAEPAVQAPEIAQEPAPTNDLSLDFDLGLTDSLSAPEEIPAPTEEAMAEVMDMAGDIDVAAVDFNLDAVPAVEPELEVPVAELSEPESVDFDLDVGLPAEAPAAPAEQPVVAEENALDVPDDVIEMPEMPAFEAAEPEAPESSVEAPPAVPEAATDVSLDFDFDLETPLGETQSQLESGDQVVPPVEEPELTEESAAVDTDGLDFNLDLSQSVVEAAPVEAPSFDMSSINLDLSADLPTAEAVELPEVPDVAEFSEVAKAPAEQATAAVHDARWEEINTKLDLAKAYEEMGDLDGARELLQEVMDEGSSDLVEEAEGILERLNG